MKSLQQIKYDTVLENIKEVLVKKGLDALTISDIAKLVHVGEATLYRYFGSKTNLAIQVGIALWTDIHEKLVNRGKQSTGFLSLVHFFNFFADGFDSHREVYSFLDQFDRLMVKENANKGDLVLYDQKLLEIKTIFDDLFLTGIHDKSIREDIHKDAYYYTTTHMVLGICKKLASQGHILPSDALVSDMSQIKLALDMCLHYIKREGLNS